MLLPIKSSGKVVVIGATKGDFQGETGRINYYKLSIAGADGTCDMVACNEDVYNSVMSKEFQRFKEYTLCGSFNTSNNRAKWERIEG